MNKKLIRVIAGIAIILAVSIFSIIYLKVSDDYPSNASGSWYYTDTYTVEDGEILAERTNGVIDIAGKGTCNLSVKWYNSVQPGCLPLMTVTSDDGEVVAWVSGDSVTTNLQFNTEEATNYTVETTYYVSAEDFKEKIASFDSEAANNINIKEDGSFDGFISFGEEGTWTTQYTVDMEFKSASSNSRLVGCIVGFLGGLGIAIILLVFVKKKGEYKDKFDERQILVRGRAFKYGMITALIYFAILGILTEGKLLNYFKPSGLIMVGVLLSIGVCAGYAIWNDGYFSLSTNKNRLIVSFGIITVFMASTSVLSILSGMIIDDGKISFLVTNIFGTIMFIVIFVILIIKAVIDSRED